MKIWQMTEPEEGRTFLVKAKEGENEVESMHNARAVLQDYLGWDDRYVDTITEDITYEEVEGVKLQGRVKEITKR